MSNRYIRLEDAQNLICDIARNMAIHSDNDDVVSALSKLSSSAVLDLFYISKIVEKAEE